MLSSPRVYYAMARDGLFFHRLAEVHPRFRTPAFAVIAGAIWSAILAITGTFEQLLTYVIFIGWIFYALAGAAIFVYRRRMPNAVRIFRVPGYPITPLLFVIAAAALALNTIVTQPTRAGTGIVIVLLGAPAYLIWRKRLTANTLKEAKSHLTLLLADDNSESSYLPAEDVSRTSALSSGQV
jgi:basic amino acid/polyamine antiporter, APA family